MANMTFGVNILPKDNTVYLGNSSYKWNIESPNLTGTPTAPTASVDTNNTQVATTAFVKSVMPQGPTIRSITATAGRWSNSAQSISCSGVTASNTILVSLSSSATAAQREAAGAAQIACTAQAANSVTLTCFGDVPTVDIPITVAIFI